MVICRSKDIMTWTIVDCETMEMGNVNSTVVKG